MCALVLDLATHFYGGAKSKVNFQVPCGHVVGKWQPIPVFLPGESHGQRSLVGYSPWGRKESDTTERLHFHFSLSWALVWRIGGLRRGGMYGNWGSRKVITALRPRAHGKDRMSIART